MNKLSNVTYKRLLAQAEEAKELKLEKLAENVLGSIGPVPRDEGEDFTYSYEDLRNVVKKSLWKVAIEIVAYHDVAKSDIQKIDLAIENLTDEVLATVEGSLNSLDKIGPSEPGVLGQSK